MSRAPLSRRRILPALALALLPLASAGQDALRLSELSLEELSSIEVTTVGKRVQRLADVAGSVYVISQEDIRRSGAATLPEVLRLAPNLHVARADANQYAIAARGFSSVLANKLLVLVDGRTVYSPLFSGVFWEAQDLLLDDIDRIEVLSGAGGTLYGSNAVNGVINVITRSAAETPGALVKLGAGDEDRVAAVRYGAGADDGLHWRAYARRHLAEATTLANGAPARDASHRSVAGFRADRSRGTDHLTVQGDLYEGHLDQAPAARRIGGANLLARWTREGGDGVRTQLQGYFDRVERRQPGAIDDELDTWDVELQQALRPRTGHELLWGAGYRWQDDRLVNLAPAVLRFEPASRRQQLWNVFAQDEVALTPELHATLGVKAEHNSYTGLEWLPNARLAWQFRGGYLAWATASRAVRAPSRIDRDVRTPLLPLGGRGFDSEVARVYELGVRGQPRAGLSFSATLFHHDFDRLRSVDLRPGGVAFGNAHDARLTGLEAWGQWRMLDALRLQAGYVHQKLRVGTAPGARVAPGSTAQLGNDPRYRATLGLGWDIAPRLEFDLQLRRVGALPTPALPAYTAADLRLGWRAAPGLELSVALRNLGPRHGEWGAAGSNVEFGRSVFVKAVWRQ